MERAGVQENQDQAASSEPGRKVRDGYAVMHPAGQGLQRLRQAVNVSVTFTRAAASLEGRTLTRRTQRCYADESTKAQGNLSEKGRQQFLQTWGRQERREVEPQAC